MLWKSHNFTGWCSNCKSLSSSCSCGRAGSQGGDHQGQGWHRQDHQQQGWQQGEDCQDGVIAPLRCIVSYSSCLYWTNMQGVTATLAVTTTGIQVLVQVFIFLCICCISSLYLCFCLCLYLYYISGGVGNSRAGATFGNQSSCNGFQVSHLHHHHRHRHHHHRHNSG